MNNPDTKDFPIHFPVPKIALFTRGDQKLDAESAASLIGGYLGIIKLFCTILYEQKDEDTPGSSRLFVERHKHYGYLRFAWGSCGGCDEYKACQTPDDYYALAEKLYQQTTWLGQTPQEVKSYFDKKDWQDAYFGDEDYERRSSEFITGALNSVI